jgi:hypothetical protein
MSKLITELKKDHADLAQLLNKVRDPQVTNEEAHKILLAAQHTLIAHLKKEDLQLYPVLHRAAESNTGLKRTVDFYAKDMAEITAKTVEFFAKYPRSESHIGLSFAKDFGNLFATISRRLRSEESTLYKEFEKLQA